MLEFEKASGVTVNEEKMAVHARSGPLHRGIGWNGARNSFGKSSAESRIDGGILGHDGSTSGTAARQRMTLPRWPHLLGHYLAAFLTVEAVIFLSQHL